MSRFSLALFASALMLSACIGETETRTVAAPEQTDFTKLLLDCEADGGGEACLKAGKEIEAGALAEPDPKGACVYYQRACSQGQTEGCTKEAMCLEAGTLGEPQYAKARDLFLTACTRGDRTACESVLSILREGRPGLEPDLEGATELLKAGCEQGNNEACAELGDGEEAPPVEEAEAPAAPPE